MGYDYSPNEEAGNTAWVVLGGVGALTATSAVLPASSDATAAPRRLAAPLWVGALLIVLAFLVIYPKSLRLKALHPAIDGYPGLRCFMSTRPIPGGSDPMVPAWSDGGCAGYTTP